MIYQVSAVKEKNWKIKCEIVHISGTNKECFNLNKFIELIDSFCYFKDLNCFYIDLICLRKVFNWVGGLVGLTHPILLCWLCYVDDLFLNDCRADMDTYDMDSGVQTTCPIHIVKNDVPIGVWWHLAWHPRLQASHIYNWKAGSIPAAITFLSSDTQI